MVSRRRKRYYMATIQPKGEKVRQAVKWISENRKQEECKPMPSLIQKASAQFNLSPQDEEFLVSFYRAECG
jgi:hypothetical protein